MCCDSIDRLATGVRIDAAGRSVRADVRAPGTAAVPAKGQNAAHVLTRLDLLFTPHVCRSPRELRLPHSQ